MASAQTTAAKVKTTAGQETDTGAPIQTEEEQQQTTALTTARQTTQTTQQQTQARTTPTMVKLAFSVVSLITFRIFVGQGLAKMHLALIVRAKLTGRQKSMPMKRLALHRFFSWRINDPLL